MLWKNLWIKRDCGISQKRRSQNEWYFTFALLQKSIFYLGVHVFVFFFSFIFISWRLITSQHFSGFCHTLKWISQELHVFPILIPPPTSLPTQILWVFPVRQARALVSCIPPGLVISFIIDNIHVVLSKHPTLASSHRVQKSVLYICVSFSVLHIGLFTIFLNSIYMC